MKLVKLKAFTDYTYIRIETVRRKCQPWWRKNGGHIRVLCYLLCLVLATYVSAYVRDQSRDPAVLGLLKMSQLRPYFPLDPVYDFLGFPCFPGIAPSDSLRSRGTCVRIMDRSNLRFGITLMESCKYLAMGERTPICSFNSVKNDTSEYYSKEGIGERKQVEDMIKVLKYNPEMRFIDIGTRAGVYCIAASKVNNRTLCLDANYRRLRQITRSLLVGSIVNNALMIWNKLSNKHETTEFVLPSVPDPIVLDDFLQDSEVPRVCQSKRIKVNTITMNDLTDAFNGKPVFVKLDISADLDLILAGSRHFFKRKDVRIVQLALSASHKDQWVITFFKRFGFLPYLDVFGNKALIREGSPETWSKYVYFLR